MEDRIRASSISWSPSLVP